MKNIALAAVAGSVLLTGSAFGATFSFAADAFGSGPQIVGAPGGAINSSLSQGSGNTGTLFVDADGNGPGLPVSIPVAYTLTATMTGHQSNAVAPGIFLHSYAASGQLTMVESGVVSPRSLNIQFGLGVFTSISSSVTAWGGSATIQGSDQAGTVTFSAGPGGGFVADSLLTSARSFSFGLSNVVLSTGGQVTLGSVGGATGFVSGPWQADASFTAFAVPTPGSVALLALGGVALVFGRKRR